MKKNHFVLIGLAVVAVTIFYGVSIKPAEPVSLTALTVGDGPVSVTVTPIFSDTKWSFNPIVPQPRFIELILKDIGGVEERGFLWMTS